MTSESLFLETFSPDELAAHLSTWITAFPQSGVMVLLPEAEKSNIEVLQKLCRELSIPLLGAVFPALLVNSQFHQQGVLLLRFDDMPVYMLEENVGEEAPEAVATRVAGELEKEIQDDEAATLFLIFDAMVADIASILEQLYLALADKVHYMGVNAGSETFQPMPCLFDSQRVVSNGLLAMLLKKHPGAVLEHGYHAPEYLVAATSTAGNRIDSIDWRPAFEVYSERVQSQYGVEITKDNFYQYGVHFPFGIIRADSEILVRIPVALEDDGSLFCIGEVPPNSVLTLLQAPQQNSSGTADSLAARLPVLDPVMDILTFYCAGRRMHLGDGAISELQAIEERIGDKHLIGAVSLGEIGSSREGGYPLFHNATLVCTRL